MSLQLDKYPESSEQITLMQARELLAEKDRIINRLTEENGRLRAEVHSGSRIISDQAYELEEFRELAGFYDDDDFDGDGEDYED